MLPVVRLCFSACPPLTKLEGWPLSAAPDGLPSGVCTSAYSVCACMGPAQHTLGSLRTDGQTEGLWARLDFVPGSVCSPVSSLLKFTILCAPCPLRGDPWPTFKDHLCL